MYDPLRNGALSQVLAVNANEGRNCLERDKASTTTNQLGLPDWPGLAQGRVVGPMRPSTLGLSVVESDRMQQGRQTRSVLHQKIPSMGSAYSVKQHGRVGVGHPVAMFSRVRRSRQRPLATCCAGGFTRARAAPIHLAAVCTQRACKG